jgi:phosphatidate phosphatase APP1
MEITQEEKSSGENLPKSSLEEVGGVLKSTPSLSTGSTNILQDDSQVGENADNEVNPQVPESTPKNKEIDSGEVSEVSEVSNGATTRSHRNTRSASDIGGVPLVGKQRDSNTEVSSDDDGNYIDYSCSYYSFNII